MSNKVYIKNNLKKLNDKELAEQLESEAKKRMLWGFQKDRTKSKEKKRRAR